ncbi:Protein kinase domain-containing protein [Mycena indigotica]|uniref:Protein kinase domain-containing protein n=1 Tax=Mycena indigotica TaxID=2126181 RepID=A0A8H6T708_9AGAR|nr:Protein kinase domain-containing protein [Mycena indigotica]KAF7312075.1 Protein kinase domain-containing protein [Mycena indigotica]
MTWDHPHDARNLAAHCSRYALPEDAFSEVEPLTSGNAHVVSTASLRGHKGKIILKRWHGSSVSDSERRLFTERLINDLDRWRALERHPNILPVLGVALHISNLPALVVPCYPTAKEVLKKDVDRLVDVLPLLQDVASGLSFLHSSSPTIAHGDIKASTILLRPRTNVKSHKPQYSALLSDIGIASIPQPPDWTFHGVDDARWLAPEIMDPSLRPRSQSDVKYRCNDSDPIGTLSVTPESDVYSLGMLSYEMYSRSPPFSSTVWSAAVVMSVVGGKRPSRPEALTSDAIWMLIECCWKQTWWERPDIKTVSAWLDILGVA